MTTAAVIAIGVMVVIALLYWLARVNPGASASVAGVVGRKDGSRTVERPPELKTWEADLLAASTGGGRGRGRLARRLEPLIETALRDRAGLSIDDPDAVELLGAEWMFIKGGPRPAASPRMDVESAVGALLDRLDTASAWHGA